MNSSGLAKLKINQELMRKKPETPQRNTCVTWPLCYWDSVLQAFLNTTTIHLQFNLVFNFYVEIKIPPYKQGFSGNHKKTFETSWLTFAAICKFYKVL